MPLPTGATAHAPIGAHPLVGEISELAASETPLLVGYTQQSTQRHDQLVDDALFRLGVEPPPHRPSAAAGADTHITLGQEVPMGHGSRRHDWTIVDARPGGEIDLARRANDGTIQRTQTSLNYLRSLEDRTITSAATRTGRLIADRPTRSAEAVRLRELVGDRGFVVSSLADTVWGAQVLVGTDTNPAPGAAGAAQQRAAAVRDWYRDVAGLTVDAEPSARWKLVIDDSELLDNAWGGIESGTPTIRLGIADPALQRQVIERIPDAGLRAEISAGARQLARHETATIAHETGHQAIALAWGLPEVRFPRMPVRAALEEGVVQEALPNLLAGAYLRRARLGIDDLAHIPGDVATLTQLRSQIAHHGAHWDIHRGTQLITAPVAELARAQGWDGVAAVTGSAIRSLSTGIHSGRIESVSIPMAATAIRDAAAWRWGASSAAVELLERGWRTLHVL